MGLVHGADPEEGPGDRDPGLLGEGPKLLGRVGDEDAVAGQDDRPPGLRDLLGDQLELARVAAQVRAEAGQAGGDLLVGGVRRVGLLLEGVLRDVDVDGAGPPGPGDVEGLGEDAGEVVRVAHEVVVLGHRQGDAGDVDLLEGVLAEERGRDVAGDGDDRDRVELGGGDPGDEVRGGGAGGAQADAHPAGGAGVAVGGVGGALLVADEDVAQVGVVAQDVVERQDDAARVAEQDVDALAEDRLHDDVGTDPGAPSASLGRLVAGAVAFVEHLAAGLLDRVRGRRPGAGHVAAAHAAGRGPIVPVAGAVASGGPAAPSPFVIAIGVPDLPGPRRRCPVGSGEPVAHARSPRRSPGEGLLVPFVRGA